MIWAFIAGCVCGAIGGAIAGTLVIGTLFAEQHQSDEMMLGGEHHKVIALALHIHDIEGHGGEMEMCGRWPCARLRSTERENWYA